ncbi:hypothetical protein FPF71_07105 [Algibacter amylolyticus]|uniref:Uncharacterized protein n=1 Tax=Algibacter amylolyticus TaxID=1608400 RepID=A0A5M7BE38_9FLAO|nr:hypothetical protein [Algibacter amylolyticus]KAA5825671.1 hypothetical protein F2B50_07105 [Algibacter amylolyticus]MBB5268099.1 hypothetical protein [Algibacter amylolyticus]TSJ79969.1 hypothetical protein FPF71_07105 [Algibacter amylolyticus]
MKNKFLKLGLALIAVMTFSLSNAQQITGDVGATEKVGKSSVLNGTIRVIDNKGTKKYLQVKNGLTLLTDATPDGGIVSTWQLGGTLTDDTNIATGDKEFKITLDTGGTFVLDGVLQETGVAATAGTLGTSGYTILVRDEATGETRKILATDLVQAGQLTATATADGTAPTLADVSIPAVYQKVWVYRNGAKLLANVDYTVAAGAVTLVPNATAPNDWAIYADDVFEVQWIN